MGFDNLPNECNDEVSTSAFWTSVAQDRDVFILELRQFGHVKLAEKETWTVCEDKEAVDAVVFAMPDGARAMVYMTRRLPYIGAIMALTRLCRIRSESGTPLKDIAAA